MFYSKKLKRFKEIKHCFFSKRNGFSKGIYKSLNCGHGSKDNKKNIQKNLKLVAKKMRVIAVEKSIYFHGFKNTKMGEGHWNKSGHETASKLISKGICKYY